eukprot:TRINITY_DN15584_c0_g1_i5.p1 TRINITY_DN15584_c0_g1~~TRINITY_DN15584_c0_g1_i5.p1  ORF type:complete len:122 (+),score=7.35 TRINITY_DN15584_c0_g1_i5:124-489(+)
MGVSRATVKVFMGMIGGLQILCGVATMLLTCHSVDHETARRQYKNADWLPAFFVYGACIAVVVLGLFYLVSCKFPVPVFIVFCIASLVYNSWDHGVRSFLRGICGFVGNEIPLHKKPQAAL